MPYKDPIKQAEYNKAYREKNKVRAYERVKEWRAANPEKWKEQRKRYSKKHPDLIAAKILRWKKANPERVAEISRKTRVKNKARILATKAKHRASKRNRTPIWVDKEHLWLIKQAYELAILRTKQFGFPWHVDHVIPLNGKTVSGLHVIENLQVIPGVENLLKNNKYEIEHA
jgi:5-methylcytosine-specific restriction endonuclease McrA